MAYYLKNANKIGKRAGDFSRGVIGVDQASFNSLFGAIGEAVFSTPGTYSWICPAGVTAVSAVCVGGGGSGRISTGYSRGAAGGGLGWKNNIPVTPGQSYTVVVGAGGVRRTSLYTDGAGGGVSYFINTSTVAGYGGIGGNGNWTTTYSGGNYVGDGGGRGGGPGWSYNYSGGGGGAGGYSGSGGHGSGTGYYSRQNPGNPGSGGGGGGGAGGASNRASGGGGGTGIYGEGESGAGGNYGNGNTPSNYNGAGGDGGSWTGDPAHGGLGGGSILLLPTSNIGGGMSNSVPDGTYFADGGWPGGGGGSTDYSTSPYGAGKGGDGAVRIIWGDGRAFPSTNAGYM